MASTNAKKLAFMAHAETCPYVDDAFSKLHDVLSEKFDLDYEERQELWESINPCIDEVKNQTTSLREALISAYQELEDVQDELKEEIASLQDRLSKSEGW